MEKIRKGNDIVILWDIFKIEDGAEVPYDLTGKSLALYLNNAVEKVKVSDFSVSENTVRMVFWGKEQKNSGIYSLTLVENEGLKGMYTVDECSAFELVPRSCLAGGSQESKVDIVTLKLRGTMMVGGGVVDDHLSDTSENAVMNRVVTEELNRKAYAEDVPQRLSQLTDDVGLVTIEDVPTKVSELENDAEYTNKEYVDYYINYLYDGKASKADLAKKQDVLRAGTGIVINGNTVYCTLDTSVFKVVSYLPETGELQKIYLVPSDIRGEKNIYKEYAYIGNKWEVIGEFTSDIDLSEYAKKEDIHTPDWNAGEGEEGHILNRTHYADFVEVDIPEDIASSEAEVTIPHIVGAPILVHYRGYVTSKYLKISPNDQELHVLSYGPAFKIRRGDGNNIFISGHNSENHRLYIATHFVALNEIFLPETIARKSEMATINGQSLTEGGDIVIEGGEGSYDDTEIQNKLTELSAEKEDKSNKTTTLSSASTDTQYPSAKAVFTAIGKKSEVSLEALANGNLKVTINGVSKDFMPATPSGDPMHDKYIAAGCVYNEETNLWSYGGSDAEGSIKYLDDLTTEDVRNAYMVFPSFSHITPFKGMWGLPSFKTRFVFCLMSKAAIVIDGAFQQNANLEFIYSNRDIIPSSMIYALYDCKSLRYFHARMQMQHISSQSALTMAFAGCTKLETIKLFKIKHSYDFKDSSLLSNDSILYMIKNEDATSAITITLHADAYARAMADAEITAALAAHPNVSLAKA